MVTATTNLRVIQTITADIGPYNQNGPSKVDESVTWAGDSIEELSQAFPPSQISGADPLGHSAIEDGLIRFDYRFERELSNGKWEEIEDPRIPVSTPASRARDRAQDEENRRLYPGDYEADDYDDFYDGDGYDDHDRYSCAYCRDSGCKECVPSCRDCGDSGCMNCKPNAECKTCFDEGCNRCNQRCSGCKAILMPSDTHQCFWCRLQSDPSFNPRCAGCRGVLLEGEQDLCMSCEAYYAPKFCPGCGLEHEDHTMLPGELCAECEDKFDVDPTPGRLAKFRNRMRRAFLRHMHQ